MTLNSIVVNDSGTQIAYLDSAVFKRVQNVALKRGVRFISLNRRGYPGTTPCTEEEVNAIVSGTKEQKDAWHRDRGHEVGMFIHRLIDQENIPPISVDNKTGGVIVFGWSSGAGDANDTIAHADTLPSDMLSGSCSVVCLNRPITHPWIDNRIPEEDRPEKFAHWISSYFQHGDTSTKVMDVLSWVEPSTIHPASINNMTAEEKEAMICMQNYEVPYMPSVKTLFPHFKATILTGELSPACAISSYWMVENDAKEAGKHVNFVVIPDSNHFLHWDNPEEALKIYLDCA
ncbi:hypothetical protein F5887DRAFT_1213937 [Amanita rubescens]|nr:hypothetical protein F5887DRAFT_1213937 [Amanita rubescens]